MPQSLRRKIQTNLETNMLNESDVIAGLTEKQCRANKITAAPRSLKALVR
jgi:hypothetical protein